MSELREVFFVLSLVAPRVVALTVMDLIGRSFLPALLAPPSPMLSKLVNSAMSRESRDARGRLE